MIHAENAKLKAENRELREQVTDLMRTVMDLRPPSGIRSMTAPRSADIGLDPQPPHDEEQPS